MPWRRIVERGGHRALHVDHVVVAQPVELARSDAGEHMRRDVIEHLAGKHAGDAHLLDVLGGFERYRHQLRNNSLMLVLARVPASTRLTMTAQYKLQVPSPDGRIPATTTDPDGTRPYLTSPLIRL